MGKPMVVLYGSQTGIAESIAKGLNHEATSRGFDSSCHVMDSYEQADFPSPKILVAICSSTGDGDAPDNAAKFLRFLRKSSPGSLAHMKMAFLALGDTNYSNFCGGGMKVHKRLVDLGAKEFYPLGKADDGTGLDKVVEPWIENLWPALKEIYSVEVGAATLEATFSTLAIDNPAGVPEETTGEGKKGAEEGAEKDKEAQAYSQSSESTLIINYPTSQDILKGIPKLADPLYKVTFHEGETRLPEDSEEYLFKRTPNSPEEEGAFSSTHPFPAKLLSVQCLTSPDALKKTLKIELDIAESGIQYQPGDALGFVCPNEKSEVLEIIRRLNLRPETILSITSTETLPFSFRTPCTVFECLSYSVNLRTVAKKSFYRMMAEYAKDTKERYYLMYLCSRAGATEFQNLRNQDPSVVELLRSFPSSKFPLERILDNCFPLQPRYYSVASSPFHTPFSSSQPTFVFNVVDYQTQAPFNRPRKGLCTGWIESMSLSICKERSQGKVFLKNPTTIPVFLKKNEGFLLPQNAEAPLIMVGPGTGVAPFIGFLEHLKALRDSNSQVTFGPAWLFFGCRDRTKDFLFEDELREFEKAGILSKLVVSFSRELTTKAEEKYVQHQMRIYGKELFELLVTQKGTIMICGDAAGMSKDVNECLFEILSLHGGMSPEEAKATVHQWEKEKRLVRDVWA